MKYVEEIVNLLRNKWANKRRQSHFRNLLMGDLPVVQVAFPKGYLYSDCYEFRKSFL